MAKKRSQVNLRIPKEDKKLLEKDANHEGRSVSNLLLWCWKQWRNEKAKVKK